MDCPTDTHPPGSVNGSDYPFKARHFVSCDAKFACHARHFVSCDAKFACHGFTPARPFFKGPSQPGVFLVQALDLRPSAGDLRIEIPDPLEAFPGLLLQRRELSLKPAIGGADRVL